MKKKSFLSLALCILLLVPTSIMAQDVVIDNSVAGELSTKVTDNSVTSLVVTGKINRLDLDYINNTLTALKNLDLRNTQIMSWTDPDDPEWGIYPADQFPSSFASNRVIERLVLPESITSMGVSCLNNPTSLNTLISYATVPPAVDDWYPFIGSPDFLKRCKLYVPKAAMEAYETALGWDFKVFDVETEGNDVPDNKANYELSEDGKTLLKWTGEMDVINLNDYPELKDVEVIGETAFGKSTMFEYNAIIKEVTLTDKIHTISDYAFANCSALEKVNVGTKLESIGAMAFMGCEKLNNVVLPTSVTTMGRACFSGCSALSNITWPVKIKELPNSLFYKCTSLESIEIPDAVETIQNSVFEECSALKSIKWGSNVKEIGYSTFAYCTSLTTLNLPASLKTIGEDCFTECSALNKVDFGGLENVSSSAFKGCSINEANFSSSKIRTIGIHAFNGNALKELVLPSSLETLQDCAFQNCADLLSVVIPNDAPINLIGERAFKLCSSLKDVNMGAVQEIGNGAFAMCDKLENIKWSEQLKTIGGTAFMSCTQLKEISLPESVELVDDWAFYECTGLKSVSAGNHLTTIGQECFALCTALKSIEIGNALSTIKNWAFQKNTALESFKVKTDKVPALEEDVFTECNLAQATLYTASGLKVSYEAAPQWKAFGKIIEMETTGIANSAIDTSVKAIYSLDGVNRKSLVKGVNIVRMSDGKIKKVYVK